ncbi:MAG: hypothetical protein DMF51_08045 [Acidobacteria bacterium]|nr:MAG: hypothetical protein DMF51_08045 [Acidobacteriota bacterium]
MTHDEAVLLLPDLSHDRLDAGVAAQARSHLSTCTECRATAETYERLLGAPRSDSSRSGAAHPSSAEIVRFALRSDDLQTEDLARLASHLRSCPGCAADVRLTREAESAGRAGWLRNLLGNALALLDVRRPALAAAVATGLAVAVMGYPAFLGLYRLPRAAGDAERARQAEARAQSDEQARMRQLTEAYDLKLDDLRRSVAPAEPIDLNFLVGAMRDAGPTSRLTIKVDRPLIHLAIAPDGRSISRSEEPYRFEILAKERTIHAWELAGRRIRDYLDSPQGAVIFTVPASELSPGVYRLRLVSPRKPGSPLFESSFATVP